MFKIEGGIGTSKKEQIWPLKEGTSYVNNLMKFDKPIKQFV